MNRYSFDSYRILAVIVCGVLIVNSLIWVIGDLTFLADARDLDKERAERQVEIVTDLLHRESQNLQRIIFARSEWLAREAQKQGGRWNSLDFPEFVTEAFLFSANVDSYLIEDHSGRVLYSANYSQLSENFSTLPSSTQNELEHLVHKHADDSSGVSGIHMFPDGRISLVVIVPIGPSSRFGWVAALRDLDDAQIQTYGDFLDTPFTLEGNLSSLGDGDDPGVHTVSVDTDTVRWTLVDASGNSALHLTMPFDRGYEQHVIVTATINRLIIFLLSLGIALLVFLFYRQRQLSRQREDISRRELERVARLAAVGELAAGVAHEINNPSGMIQRNLDFVRDVLDDALPMLAERDDARGLYLGGVNFETAREQLPQLVDDMATGSRRIGEIVRDLKDFAREENPDDMAVFDLNEVAAASVRLLDGTLRKASDHVRFEPAPSVLQVAGSLRQIEQVVINLLQNACHALESREQAITLTTRHASEKNRVCLMVEDQGRGVAADDMERIFDPFFTTRRETGGTGLGLSVSLRIIRRHGGNLEVDSMPGRGTQMTLTLPVAKE